VTARLPRWGPRGIDAVVVLLHPMKRKPMMHRSGPWDKRRQVELTVCGRVKPNWAPILLYEHARLFCRPCGTCDRIMVGRMVR